MTAGQYRAALARLALTQVGAARAAHGVSGTAAILLWLMMDGKVTPADIEAVYQ